jgi:hypothetical protein
VTDQVQSTTRLPPRALPLVALLATAPLALIRRFPATSIGLVLSASALFMIFGRLIWPVPAIAGWLMALARARQPGLGNAGLPAGGAGR